MILPKSKFHLSKPSKMLQIALLTYQKELINPLNSPNLINNHISKQIQENNEDYFSPTLDSSLMK